MINVEWKRLLKQSADLGKASDLKPPHLCDGTGEVGKWQADAVGEIWRAERVQPVSGRRREIATITPERRLGSLSDDLGVDFAAVLAEKEECRSRLPGKVESYIRRRGRVCASLEEGHRFSVRKESGTSAAPACWS